MATSACSASRRAASTTGAPSSADSPRRTRGPSAVASRFQSSRPSSPRRYVPDSRTSAYGRPARSHDETSVSSTDNTVEASPRSSVAGRPSGSAKRRRGAFGAGSLGTKGLDRVEERGAPGGGHAGNEAGRDAHGEARHHESKRGLHRQPGHRHAQDRAQAEAHDHSR